MAGWCVCCRGLLTQAQRLEAILAQLDPTDVSLRAEYEDQISPAERAQLSKYKNMTKKCVLVLHGSSLLQSSASLGRSCIEATPIRDNQ